MFLARITGSLVATHKVESLIGQKLLLVEPLRVDEKDQKSLKPTGRSFVVVDTVGAGEGEAIHAGIDGEAAGDGVAAVSGRVDGIGRDGAARLRVKCGEIGGGEAMRPDAVGIRGDGAEGGAVQGKKDL